MSEHKKGNKAEDMSEEQLKQSHEEAMDSIPEEDKELAQELREEAASNHAADVERSGGNPEDEDESDKDEDEELDANA